MTPHDVPHEGWVHVGWWHWWDGNTTRNGNFRHDHPGDGISVPVFRPPAPK